VVDDGIPREDKVTMSMDEVTDARHRARQWLEDGQRSLTVLLTVLNDYDRLNDRLGASERENAKLQAAVLDNEDLRRRLELAERESERLQKEVGQGLAELERGAREREEIADQLSQVMNDTLARLRSQRIAYASGSAAGVKAASL
jgi:regulator of replication initiation timing